MFSLLLFLFLHPFHLSVCEIFINEKTSSFEVSQKVFLDDMENSLKETYKWENLDIVNPHNKERLDSIIRHYFLKNITLYNSDKEIPLYFLGYEIEKDVLWIYMESKPQKHTNTFFIQNTVLIDFFSDQINIIHCKKNNISQSVKLERNKKKTMIVLEK